jgi:hypothetical protein
MQAREGHRTVAGSSCSRPALQLAEALLLRQLALSWRPNLLPLRLPRNNIILLRRESPLHIISHNFAVNISVSETIAASDLV